MTKHFTLTEIKKKELEDAILATERTEISVDAGQHLRLTVFSALNGDSTAQYQMGKLYLNGYADCISPDLKDAVRYFLASAKDMNENSIIELLKLYLKDHIKLEEIASVMESLKDYSPICKTLADYYRPSRLELVYLKGKVSAKNSDYRSAEFYFEHAYMFDHVDARIAWADLILKGLGKYDPDPERAIRLLKPLAKEHASAQFQLAEVLRTTKKTPPKVRIANLYKKAAKQNHEGALAKIYECYLNGYGVDKDEVQAQKWYMKLNQLAFNTSKIEIS